MFNVHRRCIAARNRAKLSQRELARRAAPHLNRKDIAKLEREDFDHCSLPVAKFEAFAFHTGTTAAHLMYGDLINHLVFSELQKMQSKCDQAFEKALAEILEKH